VRPEGIVGFGRRGIEVGEQCVVVSLSVSLRKVGGMSEGRFGRTPGGVCSLGLHVVWCPKYRHRILGGRVASRCGLVLEQLAVEHGGQVVATAVMGDHVRPCVRVGPTDVPQVVRAFKGRTARVLRQEFRSLRRFARVWCSPPYVAASVGDVAESTVRRDIEHQCDEVAS
jgi:putative transposase